MRDLANKMAELKFVAPLAQFDDEWSGSTDSFQQYNNNNNNNNDVTTTTLTGDNKLDDERSRLDTDLLVLSDIVKEAATVSKGTAGQLIVTGSTTAVAAADNFTETISGSLEDLVNTFDEKITKCFGNFEQSVEELAPVQLRSQEEIMSECQMWWTITGNFGNILPIDWSKSCARQMHIPALKLVESRTGSGGGGGSAAIEATDDELNDLSSEDEAVANDLDMHALILGGLHSDPEPIKTAEEVIKEIDDIMDETQSEPDLTGDCGAIEKAKEVLGAMLYEEKLQQLSISQLNELFLEMETIIRELSETLILQLAYRDECEYEKELKNSFISLLLAVQNRRRQFHTEKKRGKAQGKQNTTATGSDPKYLTTVIPYHMNDGPPDNQSLQVLIKILKAINEDSPTVPTLLTDYILKVLCPT